MPNAIITIIIIFTIFLFSSKNFILYKNFRIYVPQFSL